VQPNCEAFFPDESTVQPPIKLVCERIETIGNIDGFGAMSSSLGTVADSRQ
jgi:hypothetical protein